MKAELTVLLKLEYSPVLFYNQAIKHSYWTKATISHSVLNV